MSKAILMSIRPEWCDLILQGKKTVEVRKTRPKMKTPFKVYIYCTKAPRAGWLSVSLPVTVFRPLRHRGRLVFGMEYLGAVLPMMR